ncbi:UNVERIFIED_CONTAM: HAD hydrolase family protein [Campylobacter lari]
MTREELKTNIKLAAFDIDGTILPNGTMTFSHMIKKMFSELNSNNIKTTFATAREFVTIGSLHKQLPDLDFFIGANGSFCYDLKNEKLIYERTIKFDDFKIVYDHFLQDDDALSFLIMDQNWAFKNPGMNVDS